MPVTPEPRPLNQDNPRTEYEHVPEYYHTADVPHVLARVRFINRFFDDIVTETQVAGRQSIELYDACMDLLARELAPYALDLAISLINLEDQLQTTGPAGAPTP